jgi:tRNA (cmo5U34)-methyltransferase
MSLNGFDRIAWIYDWLASVVFGASIKKSQIHFINHIPEHANVLILGGGTGWILPEILSVRPDCKIVYIEASEKMILLSKKRTTNYSHIHFIHGTELDIPVSMQFDAVITNFYLDLFPPDKLSEVIRKILSSMKREGIWIVTDFVNVSKWQGLLLKIMYYFFSVTTNIEAKHLPGYTKAIEQSGLRAIDSRKFYSGFIKTMIFRF